MTRILRDRGLDILELTPSPYLSKNEIEAAKTIVQDHLNAQGQQMFKWPASFALARAYVDQLGRSGEMPLEHVVRTQTALNELETASPDERKNALMNMSAHLEELAADAADPTRLSELAGTLQKLASM